MTARIEDYALLGNCRAAALVSNEGSIDWLCFPRFDAPACMAALLGTPENGRWRIAPSEAVRSVKRRYHDGTLILRSEEHTSELQSLMRISYAVFCLKKKKQQTPQTKQYRVTYTK